MKYIRFSLLLLFGVNYLAFTQCPPPQTYEYKNKIDAAKNESADEKVRNGCVQGWTQLAAWYAYKCECDKGLPTQESADALAAQLNVIQSTIQNMYPGCGEIPIYVNSCNVRGNAEEGGSQFGSLGSSGMTAEQAALAEAGTQLIAVGMDIANSIKQQRIENINNKSDRVNNYISKIDDLTKEVKNLYETNQTYKFFEKEKEIRDIEKKAITELDWLNDKTNENKYRAQHTKISENQLNRLKILLGLNTDIFLSKIKGLQNLDIINLVSKYRNDEILDYKYGTYYKGKSNEILIGSQRKYRDKFVQFHYEERAKRVKNILDYNNNNNILDAFHEAALYLSNAYFNHSFDIKIATFFESFSTVEERFKIATWAIYNSEGVENNLLMLLGNGERLNYYLNINQINGKKPKALYDYINDRVNKETFKKARELVHNWVKNDEKSTGKKAKQLFAERKGCLTANCVDSKSNMSSILNEAGKYVKQKKYGKALKILEMGIDLYPENPLMYYNYGLAKSLDKNIFHSIKKNIDKKINVSLANNISKNDLEAIEYLNKGIELVKDDQLLLISFYVILGNIYDKVEEFKKSDEVFSKALEIRPKNASVLNEYSWVLAKRIHRLSDAEQMIKLCNEIEPNVYNYQDTYAWVLYKQGRFKDANNWLEKAVTNGGNKSAIVWEHKGDISYKLGMKDEALKLWKNAKSISKSNGGEVSEFLSQKIKKRILIE